MNWQDKTRGGYPVRKVRENRVGKYPIEADVYFAGTWRTYTFSARGLRDIFALGDLDLMPVIEYGKVHSDGSRSGGQPISDWQEQALAAGWSPPDTAAYHRKTAEMLDDGDFNGTAAEFLARRYPGEWG